MRQYCYILLLTVLLAGCSSKKSNNPEPSQPPQAAQLQFPENNSLCVNGEVISGNESSVTFKWTATVNTDSYEIKVKNLLTGTTTGKKVNIAQATITLPRNTPFSWLVESSSTQNSTVAKSTVWKFYNAGNGVTAYAPFPADKLSPAMGENVKFPFTGQVSLSWEGNDADNDIANYDIYFGTTDTPPLYKENHSATALTNVPVTFNKTYFWRIVTRDSRNNTSSSDVHTFTTNF